MIFQVVGDESSTVAVVHAEECRAIVGGTPASGWMRDVNITSLAAVNTDDTIFSTWDRMSATILVISLQLTVVVLVTLMSATGYWWMPLHLMESTSTTT